MSDRSSPVAPAERAHTEDDRSRQVRRKRLGDRLRQMYNDIAQEPVPDDFLTLLEEADRALSADVDQED